MCVAAAERNIISRKAKYYNGDEIMRFLKYFVVRAVDAVISQMAEMARHCDQ